MPSQPLAIRSMTGSVDVRRLRRLAGLIRVVLAFTLLAASAGAAGASAAAAAVKTHPAAAEQASPQDGRS